MSPIDEPKAAEEAQLGKGRARIQMQVSLIALALLAECTYSEPSLPLTTALGMNGVFQFHFT